MTIPLALFLFLLADPARVSNPPLTGSVPPPVVRVYTPSWEITIPGTAAPMLAGMETTFAVATREGRISGHRLDTGERLWENNLDAPLAAPPLFLDGRLVIATDGSTPRAISLLEPLTGLVLSRITLEPGDELLALSAVRSGLAVTGNFQGAPGLRLYDPASGRQIWQSPLSTAEAVRVGQCGEIILAGGGDGVLTAVSAADGSRRWVETFPGAITTPAVCNGRRAWIGSADNRVHALRMGRRGCRKLWAYSTGGDIAGRLILFNHRLSFFSYDTYLYSLTSDNGHLQWKVRLGRRPQTDSVLVGGILVLAQLNTERLELFSMTDGGPSGSLSLAVGEERFVTPPARAGRMVVIGAARYGEESTRIVGIAPLADPVPAGADSAPR